MIMNHSPAGIVRVTQVSESWLQNYVNGKYKAIPQKINAAVKKSRLTVECDEM